MIGILHGTPRGIEVLIACRERAKAKKALPALLRGFQQVVPALGQIRFAPTLGHPASRSFGA
jgi:hypothetical protein